MSEAFDQGYDAYYADIPLDENPYLDEAHWWEYCDWQDGWRNAEDDHNYLNGGLN